MILHQSLLVAPALLAGRPAGALQGLLRHPLPMTFEPRCPCTSKQSGWWGMWSTAPRRPAASARIRCRTTSWTPSGISSAGGRLPCYAAAGLDPMPLAASAFPGSVNSCGLLRVMLQHPTWSRPHRTRCRPSRGECGVQPVAEHSLAALYEPPRGLIFHGTFEEAKESAQQKGRWLVGMAAVRCDPESTLHPGHAALAAAAAPRPWSEHITSQNTLPRTHDVTHTLFPTCLLPFPDAPRTDCEPAEHHPVWQPPAEPRHMAQRHGALAGGGKLCAVPGACVE